MKLKKENEFDGALSQLSTALKATKILDKAKKDGVELKELSLVTRGGKTQCLSKKEIESQNKRQTIVDKLRKRVLRGENNMADEFSQRVSRCQQLTKFIAKASSLSDKAIVALQRNLESTQNRAASLIKEVSVLETAIERKKQEDPVISSFEKASAELFKAIQDNDYSKISELRTYCEENKNAYNLNKKRLKPYFTNARKARLKFIEEKRRMMRIQHETFSHYIELIANQMVNGQLHFLDLEAQKKLTKIIHQFRNLRSHARPSMEKITSSYGNVALSFINDIEEELDQIDENFLKPMDEKIIEIQELIAESFSETKEADSVKKSSSASRMVIQQKREE